MSDAYVPTVQTPSAASLKKQALGVLRAAATVEGDAHFDDHLIEFRKNGWTVQHPVAERIEGSLFECRFANWDGGDVGLRGRYVLYYDEDQGALCIGDPA